MKKFALAVAVLAAALFTSVPAKACYPSNVSVASLVVPFTPAVQLTTYAVQQQVVQQTVQQSAPACSQSLIVPQAIAQAESYTAPLAVQSLAIGSYGSYGTQFVAVRSRGVRVRGRGIGGAFVSPFLGTEIVTPGVAIGVSPFNTFGGFGFGLGGRRGVGARGVRVRGR